VVLTPKQTKLIVQGAPAMCEMHVIGCPIIGCLQPPSPATKPCTMVVIAANTVPTKLSVQGMTVANQSLTGMTDGVPPGAIMVQNPGQVKLQA
jgi:hypothetical protein